MSVHRKKGKIFHVSESQGSIMAGECLKRAWLATWTVHHGRFSLLSLQCFFADTIIVLLYMQYWQCNTLTG